VVARPAQIFRRVRGIKSGAEEQAIIDRIAAIPQLVIDDIGVEKNTGFSLAVLYEIIDARDMAYNKGLIVTSNLSLGALADRLGDDRVTSRLAGMCKVVEITGPDRRQPKNTEGK
jgi:DNA replication protein DnaC